MNQCTSFANKLKLDFSINVDLSDVVFTKCNIKKYNENVNNIFGEKLSLIYTAEFTIYNVQFSMKILAFTYEHSNEILKLYIDLSDKHIEKEIAGRRNSLQRHRNLNAVFVTLIQFAKFVETRRLISAIVISKEPKAILSKHEDGGVYIKYIDHLLNISICIYWKINWCMKDCMIVDIIEVYFNNFVLPNGDDIRYKLTSLTHPSLDFHTKLKLWKQLLNDLRKHSQSTIQAVITITEGQPMSEADSVLVISDNEEDNNNENSSEMSKHKRRRIEPQACSPFTYVVPD